ASRVRTAKAPTRGLSALNSMAFGLAVYASRCGSPTPHARLASGRWSGATGRAFHPQGSTERFQSSLLHLIPLSQASCRNRIDRSVGRSPRRIARRPHRLWDRPALAVLRSLHLLRESVRHRMLRGFDSPTRRSTTDASRGHSSDLAILLFVT